MAAPANASDKPRFIVVGGGLAGLMSVVKITEAGYDCDVFSFVPFRRSHSVCAQGGINGAVNPKGGNWEIGTIEPTFTLYADPIKDGQGKVVLGTWGGNSMTNNDWYAITQNNDPRAKGPRR